MSFLASDVMDDAASILNDTEKQLYTYAAQLPYLQRANRQLEALLLVFDSEITRLKSSAIVVSALATTLTLPSDFLLPLELSERASGVTTDPWIPMTEGRWTEDSTTEQTTDLQKWAFFNNAINFLGATTVRDVLLKYERKIAVISSQNSPEETYIGRQYLGAKTAEYCARYIGMNSTIANEIRDNDVATSEDMLLRTLTLNAQGTRQRRPRFNTKRADVNL